MKKTPTEKKGIQNELKCLILVVFILFIQSNRHFITNHDSQLTITSSSIQFIFGLDKFATLK